jgi:hypothetical protein
MTRESSTQDPDHRLPPLSRRTMLSGAAAAAAAGLFAQTVAAPRARATSTGTVLPLVDELPAGAPDRTLFVPEEQIFAPYLLLVAPLANSVVDDDTEVYGWMEDGWWRTPNHPRNSRIMEHVSTLSWFLVNEREWNPYHLDPHLERRLDAAIGYYLSLQGPTGAWPVTYEDESLATTGFGLVSLSNLLRDLVGANRLVHRHEPLENAMRAASRWLMDTRLRHWNTPIEVANQITGGLAGVAQAAAVIGDPEIASGMDERIELLAEHAQAPAGYFHEPLAYDAGYNFEVMLPDLADLYELHPHPLIIDMVRKWTEFFGYTLLEEPDAPGWFYFSAACARLAVGTRIEWNDDLHDKVALSRRFLPEVPSLGAFFPAVEDQQESRRAWAASEGPVPPLAKGNTSPRLYGHVSRAPEGVGRQERAHQVAQLPYHRSEQFTELREGTIDQQLLFVRRPGYYLASVLGRRAYDRIRTGPGLLWHPAAGMVALSQNDSGVIWTTETRSGPKSATQDAVATFHDGLDAGAPEVPREQVGQLQGVFTVHTESPDGSLTSDLTYWSDGLVRHVRAPEQATELVPLVLRDGDHIEFSDGSVATRGTSVTTTARHVSLVRSGVRFVLHWGEDRRVQLVPTGRRLFPGGLREPHQLRIEHDGDLRLEITAVEQAGLDGERLAFSATAQTVGSPTGPRTAVHVVNLEPSPIDLRIVTGQKPRVIRGLPSGGSAYELFTAPGTSSPELATVFARSSSGRAEETHRQIRL